MLLTAGATDATMTTPWPWLVALAVAMWLLAFMWAMAEAAYSRMSLAAAQDLVDDERRNARTVRRLVRHRSRTMIAISAGKVGAQTLEILALVMALINLNWPWWVILIVSFAISVSVNAALVSFLGPAIGRRQADGVSLMLARPVCIATKFHVFAKPLMWLYHRLTPPSGLTDAEARAEMAEDLREMVDQMGQDDNLDIEEDDREMLRSVFELGTTLVREIMVPRTDMVVTRFDKPASSVLNLFVRSGFSRIPVIGDNTDDVHGIVYLKDIVSAVHTDDSRLADPVSTMMRQATFIPEMVLADDLLRMMQNDIPHIALCVDEWGGISGMVTIEDLVEEVVGEVTDEHDKHQEPDPVEIKPGLWQVPARLPVDELGELFDLEIDDEDVDTVGGLLAKAIGKVPLPGAEADVQGVWLRAETVQGRRRQIATLLAKRTAARDDDEDDQ